MEERAGKSRPKWRLRPRWIRFAAAKDELAEHPLVSTAQSEIARHRCDYRMMRTAESLRLGKRIDCPACRTLVVKKFG